MNNIKIIVSNPDIMFGKPVIKGTRISVEFILKKLSLGFSIEQLLNSYDHLKKEDIKAVIDYSETITE